MFKTLTKTLVWAALASLCIGGWSACTGKKVEQEPAPKYLWVCAEANFQRLSSPDSIAYYLDKIKDTGFTHVVVDVKPVEGEVLYKSEYFPQLTAADTVTINRDWDYLQTFIDKARERGIKVIASACIMPAGSPQWKTGLVFNDTTFRSRTCVEYKPDGTLKPIYEDEKQVAAFLNPVDPANRELAVKMIKEIVTKYDVDGLALDYCRFPDTKSDFSPLTKAAFEKYLGEQVENFPADIYTYDENGERIPGKYYKQWWAFRAGIISDLVHQISDTIKAIKPGVELNYWAASWIHAIYGHGQNWASPSSDWVKAYPEIASDEYKAAGFAPYLDNFIVGTYLERVYGADDNESIEFGLNRADTLLRGDCNLIGSICSCNHTTDTTATHNLDEAVTVCLDKTGGVMVFDLVHVVNHNQWDVIKNAFERYEKSRK